MARRRKRKSSRGRSFPVVQVVVVLAIAWGSVWLAGMLGARVGSHLYYTRSAPERPYTDEQIRSMERASPEAAAVARQDLRVWNETVEMGESIARMEGALAATLGMFAIWGTLGAIWLFGRERERSLQGDPDGLAEI